MKKMHLAKPITLRSIPKGALVLNPAADEPVLRRDASQVIRSGLVVIDCSWANALGLFGRLRIPGYQRRLPALVAGNPTNYSKLGALSSLEAVAAASYIMGFADIAKRLLSLYKWGETFLTLNRAPLDEYAAAESAEQLAEIENSYFPYAKA